MEGKIVKKLAASDLHGEAGPEFDLGFQSIPIGLQPNSRESAPAVTTAA